MMNPRKRNIIFLVEDNPDDELLTKRALKTNNLVNEIVVARDGQEALDYLSGEKAYGDGSLSERVAFVLLDLKLPKINGLDVLKWIRSNPDTKLLPVIILTSSKEESDIAESYRSGANSYIQKPVDFSKFQEAVKLLGYVLADSQRTLLSELTDQ